MKTLKVRTKSRTYPVYIGEGITGQLHDFLKEINLSPSRIMVMTDEVVLSYYESYIQEASKQLDCPVHFFVIPNGESQKSFERYYEAQTFALEKGLDRKSAILAIGGGVIGDLAGFVAATYMRGIPFIQIPTTLLAHDSAVGGKVAINHPLGKNMIGAFHQPHAVLFDVSYLNTLPLKEWRSGFAEVIKHGLIQNKSFVEELEEEIHSLQTITMKQAMYCIETGISIKAHIVEQDEQEEGVRAFLNFGHTLGHAIEASLGYGKITHGEAVTIGMLFALYVSEKVYGIDLCYDKWKNWFNILGYPTTIPAQITNEQLVTKMTSDKKAIEGQIRFVLLKAISEPIVTPIQTKEILTLLDEWRMEESQ